MAPRHDGARRYYALYRLTGQQVLHTRTFGMAVAAIAFPMTPKKLNLTGDAEY